MVYGDTTYPEVIIFRPFQHQIIYPDISESDIADNPLKTDYRNPNIAEIMLNLGYVNRFGSGVNTVSTLLEENKSNPAEFLLGDYTTFKVVVQNADVIENGSSVNPDTTNKGSIVTNDGTNNVTNDGTNTVTNDVTNGTRRNNSGTMSGTIRDNEGSIDNIQDLVLNQIRRDKRIRIKQLSKIFNKTRASMFRIIEKLKAEGKLRRVGSLKSGTWEVIE